METVKFEGKVCPAEYLGDGVYAICDGYGIWLHVGSHDFPTDRVFLESEVLKRLNNFAEGASKWEF